MPAEKGIPKPEFNCEKLDRRVYDSRLTWGWVSEDSRYIVNHDGEVFYRMDPIDLEWEEDKPELKIIVHRIDCLLYTSPSPRDSNLSRMPSSA